MEIGTDPNNKSGLVRTPNSLVFWFVTSRTLELLRHEAYEDYEHEHIDLWTPAWGLQLC